MRDNNKSRIFLEKNLQQIALEIFAETQSGEFYQREAIVPTYRKEFDYKPQYNETSFDFLKRLSTRYGQWYYFDGMRMQLGQTKASNIKLINGSSLHKFTIEANLVSHKSSFRSYDYTTAQSIRNSSEQTDTGSRDRFAVAMKFNQGQVTTRELKIGAYTNNAKNKEELEEMVKLQTQAKDANSVFYSGVSYYPIGIGQVFKIQNKTVEHELIAIEVTHHSEVNGNYSCGFKAIPADVAVPHYTNPEVFAFADSQPAKVIDNNDPEKMGRIRVEYYWNGWDNESDWMRVVQPYAGSAKGMYFRPEIGEEVRIGFDGGNAECPYVSGTYYNGQEMPEFFDSENSIKGWKLRFGMLFKFIEKIGIWLSDPSGNEIHLDQENKNINATTPETFTIRAKNIVFEASESITLKAGTDITSKADNDMTHMAGNNIAISAEGNILEKSDNRTEIADKDYIKSVGGTAGEIAGKMNISTTDDNIELHSAKNIKGHSGENSNFN
ncbi:type VI secretion system Vgr family protein [Flavobacterium artemisiae]|uniref:Type VI secretion system Vgr family protein n=1 Tax=Flavobacterium artemisiae TaxID=2126556 RepID=A0ABW4H829_9FLAO